MRVSNDAIADALERISELLEAQGASGRAAARTAPSSSRCGRGLSPVTAASAAPTPKISTGM